MSAIIEQKLGVVGEVISPLHWLRLLLKLLKWAAVNLLELPNQFLVNILQVFQAFDCFCVHIFGTKLNISLIISGTGYYQSLGNIAV